MDAYFMMEKTMKSSPEDINSNKSSKKENNIPKTPGIVKTKNKKKKKNICALNGCQNKLSIISFSCKCQKKFCSVHRLPEDHSCTFDYQTHGKCIIAKKNPQILNAKITHI